MKKWLSLFVCLLLGGWIACAPQEATPAAAAEPAPTAEITALPAEAPTPSPAPTAAPTAVPTPEPTAEPTPEPTAEPTATPEPTPEPTATPEPTKDPARLMVALTFDDGPHPKKTAPLLDLLEQYHIRATFFVLGTSINGETSPLLQRMVDMGCEIGIHGLTHGKIDNLIPSSLRSKLQKMSQIISDEIEGGYTPKLMRPPGGHFSQSTKTVTAELGLPIIMWSVDTEDWRNPKDKVLRILRNQTKNGSIILCHDKGNSTQAALEIFIPELLEQGYEFVTVSELLARHGTPAEPGAVYLCMDP